MPSAARQVAEIPELLELVLINLDSEDHKTLKTIFAGKRSFTQWHDLVEGSSRLQQCIYVADERPVDDLVSETSCKPDSNSSPEQVCSHDVKLRPNPVIPEAVPGWKSLEVDFDDYQPNGVDVCRRWHFAMALDTETWMAWEEAKEKNASWRSLLLTQPACRTVALSCLPVDWDEFESLQNSGEDEERQLHNPNGVTLGEVCDRGQEIIGNLESRTTKVHLYIDSCHEDEEVDVDSPCLRRSSGSNGDC